jgi:exodeoxyribonuclease VII small subunit
MPFMSDTAESKADSTFETSLEELHRIVHELEEGRLGLESSLARFEEGVGLLRNCYRLLEQAEQRIEMLTGTDAQGNPATAPFDATATIAANDGGTKKPGRRRAATKSASPSPEPEEADPGEQRLF